MTKDGRPSRVSDIRYFVPIENTVKYIEDHRVSAFGRRLAYLLNGENYSCGSYPALYIVLTTALELNVVQVKEKPYGEWWYREAYVGVPDGFQRSARLQETAKNATLRALNFIRPDMESAIDEAAKMVETYGDELRFLLKTKETKKYVVDVYANIPVFPQPAYLFTSFTDRTSGQFLESPPFPLMGFPAFGFSTGPIKITEILKELPSFAEKERPVMSKLVKYI
jgi:hypothetical protein